MTNMISENSNLEGLTDAELFEIDGGIWTFSGFMGAFAEGGLMGMVGGSLTGATIGAFGGTMLGGPPGTAVGAGGGFLLGGIQGGLFGGLIGAGTYTVSEFRGN